MKVAVIGGGAAGFFAAISVKEHHPEAEVTIHEKGGKLLNKVRISGGGRCNVTHHCFEIRKLSKHYPRGGPFLRKAFEQFSVRDTIAWFERRGVQFKTEADGRMFPTTDRSETIIDRLIGAASEAAIRIEDRSNIIAIEADGRKFKMKTSTGVAILTDKVIIATGGDPRPESFEWLAELGHAIIPPVPSLFTFNMPGEPIRELMGIVADPVRARIIGTDLEIHGPVLITHWGMSGPAILKLSAWGARMVHLKNYLFTLQLNWLGGRSEDEIRKMFKQEEPVSGRKQMINLDLFGLPKRLWQFLVMKAGIPLEKKLAEVGRKDRDRLIDLLTNDRYEVQGKTTFKEEFVTAGGVSLDDVDPFTMQSRKVPGMYFAGEVMDIDGITGGFNFQAAWTTGHIAGKLR